MKYVYLVTGGVGSFGHHFVGHHLRVSLARLRVLRLDHVVPASRFSKENTMGTDHALEADLPADALSVSPHAQAFVAELAELRARRGWMERRPDRPVSVVGRR